MLGVRWLRFLHGAGKKTGSCKEELGENCMTRNLKVFTVQQIHEMGGTCSTYGARSTFGIWSKTSVNRFKNKLREGARYFSVP
jgi:hypothetical protein